MCTAAQITSVATSPFNMLQRQMCGGSRCCYSAYSTLSLSLGSPHLFSCPSVNTLTVEWRGILPITGKGGKCGSYLSYNVEFFSICSILSVRICGYVLTCMSVCARLCMYEHCSQRRTAPSVQATSSARSLFLESLKQRHFGGGLCSGADSLSHLRMRDTFGLHGCV